MPEYVILGGGLAAASAAKAIREIDASSPVTIVSQETDPPYNRPDLTKAYLRGEMERTASYVEPENWYADNNVVLRLGQTATGIDRQQKQVLIQGSDPVRYDRLLYVTGASPRILPGTTGMENVFYLRTFPNADQIRQAMSRGSRALVIGGSFIGTESAASMAMKGLEVDVLNMDPNLFGRILGKEVGDHIQKVVERQGVRVHNGVKVEQILGDGRFQGLVDSNGKRWEADFLVIGAGVAPNTALAEAAGLTVNNGVVVNSHLQSSDPAIFAAGDVARWSSPVFPDGVRVEHWDVAFNQGEQAGKNMAGQDGAYDGMPFVFSDIGDTTMDVIGAASAWDEVVWRPLEGEKFLAAYLQGGKVVQGATVGDEDTLNVLGDLIRAGKDVSGAKAKLADPAFDVRSLL